MSEREGGRCVGKRHARRRVHEPAAGAPGERTAADGPRVGKRTLTEALSGGYSERDALAFFERAIGETRAQLAALERALTAADRVAAGTAAGLLQHSLRSARGHAGLGPSAGLDERQHRLAELEARASRVLAQSRRLRR
jgi:hypothetical protein